LLAAWLYAINPVVILQATNGLETALSIFTLMMFLTIYKKWLISKSLAPSPLVGVIGGFMVLARSDSFFILAFSLIAALWSHRDSLWLKKTVVAGIAALVVLTPWLIWSQLAVGSPIQESGLAVPYVLQERIPDMDWQLFLKESWFQLSNAGVWLLGTFTGMPLIIGTVLWALLLLALVRVWSTLKNREVKLILMILLGSVIALIIFHAGVRWYPRPWYFVMSALAFALCFAIVVRKYLDKPRIIFLATTLISVYFVSSGLIFWRLGFYPLQKEMLAASNWLEGNVPAGSTVGSFNAGIYSYYGGWRVVNLDGVVNHHAYEALQDRQLFSYIQSENVDYLIDFDFYIQDLYAPFMGSDFPASLQEIAVLSDLSHEGFLRVYRLKP
jgi:4-amino-4-deoxy-L-arabinose transferase-like glycosyltransferase